jgi:hypothetical protein
VAAVAVSLSFSSLISTLILSMLVELLESLLFASLLLRLVVLLLLLHTLDAVGSCSALPLFTSLFTDKSVDAAVVDVVAGVIDEAVDTAAAAVDDDEAAAAAAASSFSLLVVARVLGGDALPSFVSTSILSSAENGKTLHMRREEKRKQISWQTRQQTVINLIGKLPGLPFVTLSFNRHITMSQIIM